jgi:hypothetical protein
VTTAATAINSNVNALNFILAVAGWIALAAVGVALFAKRKKGRGFEKQSEERNPHQK